MMASTTKVKASTKRLKAIRFIPYHRELNCFKSIIVGPPEWTQPKTQPDDIRALIIVALQSVRGFYPESLS